jgi:prepilin-type N-terminal cleavage/methylation domain-containing protein
VTAGEHDHISRDRGLSLIEILVAIVLLATVGVGVMGALRSTIIGSRLERDHAKAYQWLQSADGVLQAAERVGCEHELPADSAYADGEEKVRLQYQQLIRDQVVNPDGWGDWQITVLYPVKVWDGTNYWEPAALAPPDGPCPPETLLQLVELQVSSPTGDIIETIQVVKRD